MYGCSKCSFSSDFYFSIETHEKLCHPVYPRRELFLCYNSCIEKHLCPEWDYETHLKVDFDDHLRAGHDFERKKLVHEDIKARGERCKSCGLQTFSKFFTFLHEFCENNNELAVQDKTTTINSKCMPDYSKISFKCDECSYKTKRSWDLKTHVIRKHTVDNKINWFNCTQCSYKSKLPSELAQHMRRKHSSRTCFLCDECSFKTYHKFYLKVHKINKHTPDDQVVWFSCTQCEFKSKKSQGLTEHIKRMHTPNNQLKWFKCSYCWYKSTVKSGLLRHMERIHISS